MWSEALVPLLKEGCWRLVLLMKVAPMSGIVTVPVDRVSQIVQGIILLRVPGKIGYSYKQAPNTGPVLLWETFDL